MALQDGEAGRMKQAGWKEENGQADDERMGGYDPALES